MYMSGLGYRSMIKIVARHMRIWQHTVYHPPVKVAETQKSSTETMILPRHPLQGSGEASVTILDLRKNFVLKKF